MAINELVINLPERETEVTKWSKQDTVWMLSLYGTAIGAGTLFLPINAGLSGILPLIIMLILAFPMTYFSHQFLCRFVLSGSKPMMDITAVIHEHFGRIAGNVLTFLYFFAIYPILLMYSVAITNTTESFIVNQMGFHAPSRAILAFILLFALMLIVRLGQRLIVKSMSLLVYPFIAILLLISVYLIPYWNTGVFFYRPPVIPGDFFSELVKTIWLIIPVMVFSFNHSPIISSFAVTQKNCYGENAYKKSATILKASHLMMISTVMFFVFSCVLSLSPYDLALAKQQNISVLSYLANHFHTPFIGYVAPLVAFIAISKSFLGHYLGASEGLQGLIIKGWEDYGYDDWQINKKDLLQLIDGFMLITCWVVATINPNILSMIETLGGPIIAIILFLMPVFAFFTVPALKKFRQPLSNSFIFFIGLIAISALLYGLIYL